MTAAAGGDFLRERVADFYAQNRRATAINAGLLGLALWALAGRVPWPQLLAWAAAVLASFALRLAGAALRQRDRRADAHATAWAWSATLALGSTGLAWGGGAWLLMRADDPAAEVFWTIALCGIAAGVVAGAPYFVPAQWAYLLPLLLPLVLHHAGKGTAVSQAVAGGLALFLVGCLAQGRAQARSLQDSLAIRAQNARLLDELRQRRDEALAAQRQAEEAAQAKARFFAAASHDLRQPMQALVLLDAALDSATPAERPALQSRLSEGIAALDQLFEDILSVSRLDTGASIGPLQPVLLAPLVQGLLRRLAPQARARGVQLQLRQADSVLAVQADPAALARLLGNLLANALQHAPGSRVLLALRRGAGGSVRLQVRDSGPGIAPEHQARVFEEFFQAPRPPDARTDGSGLGLAIAQRLAGALGGTLGLRSAPGRGSCFTLRLLAGPPLGAQPEPGRRQPGRPVWLLDGDPQARQALGDQLQAWGLPVQAAASADALVPDTADGPALLLCAPAPAATAGELAALERLLSACEQQHGRLPAVLLLGSPADAALQATARQRGWGWLDGPVRPMALRAAVSAVSAADPWHG